MFVLDSDIVSLAFLEHERVAARIRAAETAGERVVTSVMTRAELLRGRLDYLLKAEDGPNLLRAYDLLVRTEKKFEGIEILPVTEPAADHFERLRTRLKRKKGTHADLLIASIALAHDATLVTRNVKGFAHVPNLKVENWAD